MAIADRIEVGRLDDLSRLDTPVHRLDARAKVIVTLVFVAVVMSFPRRELSALTPFLLYPVALLSVGRIPARQVARAVLVSAPFALVVGIFNPLLDREPALALGRVSVSGGWLSFASIMLRFVLTVTAALALVASTGMVRLGAGLGRIGVPRVFVVQLLFLHRYLFLVADQGAGMARAIALRAPGPRSLRFRTYGSLVGHLLLRSLDRAERVHRAMVARGFDGEVRALRRSAFRPADWAFVGLCLGLFAIGRAWNVAGWLGGLLAGRPS